MGVGDIEKIITRPTRHLERLMGDGSVKVDLTRYPVIITKAHVGSVPGTVAITNVNISDNEWTPITTGLSDVIFWRLSERKGANFDYRYVTSGDFMSAFGEVKMDTSIPAIYVKRQGDTTLSIQAEVWTV